MIFDKKAAEAPPSIMWSIFKPFQVSASRSSVCSRRWLSGVCLALDFFSWFRWGLRSVGGRMAGFYFRIRWSGFRFSERPISLSWCFTLTPPAKCFLVSFQAASAGSRSIHCDSDENVRIVVYISLLSCRTYFDFLLSSSLFAPLLDDFPKRFVAVYVVWL